MVASKSNAANINTPTRPDVKLLAKERCSCGVSDQWPWVYWLLSRACRRENMSMHVRPPSPGLEGVLVNLVCYSGAGIWSLVLTTSDVSILDYWAKYLISSMLISFTEKWPALNAYQRSFPNVLITVSLIMPLVYVSF